MGPTAGAADTTMVLFPAWWPVGVLVALPLLAVCRAVWEYFSDRIALEPWGEAGAEPVPVPVEVESPPEPGAPTEIKPSRAARR